MPRPSSKSLDTYNQVSGGVQVDSLRTLAHAVGLNVEGDFLAIDEGAQAGSLDRGDVDEHILGAVVRRDEAEAFGGIEEFYGAGLGHLGELLHPISFVGPAA